MLRIRKDTIKIVIEQEVDPIVADGLDEAVETVKLQVADGLAKLSKVAGDFDVVEVDKNGNLHCKNIAVLVAEPEGKEVAP